MLGGGCHVERAELPASMVESITYFKQVQDGPLCVNFLPANHTKRVFCKLETPKCFSGGNFCGPNWD